MVGQQMMGLTRTSCLPATITCWRRLLSSVLKYPQKCMDAVLRHFLQALMTDIILHKWISEHLNDL